MPISADTIRGWVDLMVLSILAGTDSYGYAISQAITKATGDVYSLKETTLYTALKRLESQSFVESYRQEGPNGRPRTYYRISPAGRDYYAARSTEWRITRQILDNFAL